MLSRFDFFLILGLWWGEGGGLFFQQLETRKETSDKVKAFFFVTKWVKVFKINPEFRTLSLTFHRKSASKS